jgi:hypothetical protein
VFGGKPRYTATVKGQPNTTDLRVYSGPEWDATIVVLALEQAGIEAMSDSTETLGSRHLHSTVFVRKATELERAREIVARHMQGRA